MSYGRMLKKTVLLIKYQVDYVEPSQNVVHLKLMPRIDYTRKRGTMRTSGSVSRTDFCLPFSISLIM